MQELGQVQVRVVGQELGQAQVREVEQVPVLVRERAQDQVLEKVLVLGKCSSYRLNR